MESNTEGSNNVAIGNGAGLQNTTGTGNVFIGHESGNNSDHDTESNKLVIANSNTTTPLIDGDFSAQTLKVNGSLEVTGSYISSVSAQQEITNDGQNVNITGPVIPLDTDLGFNPNSITLGDGSSNGQELTLINLSERVLKFSVNPSESDAQLYSSHAMRFIWYSSNWYVIH